MVSSYKSTPKGIGFLSLRAWKLRLDMKKSKNNITNGLVQVNFSFLVISNFKYQSRESTLQNMQELHLAQIQSCTNAYRLITG